ncbi:pantetheine-phosphate adenylyltransferase [Streptococcus halichoeri]|uniref:pantetheine-phosphate adenylyltransferase n=1 Tax=Streptococcus halichoeri TaxID=254785 RepID=UPI0013581C21|nr:pantetheine-phosphate adenylyltransferase [Streptococcus halichoeri]
MSGKIGLYTGSFDPVTNGHMDIIARASGLFEHLYIGVFYNPEKKSFFDIATRVKVLKETLARFENVTVVSAQDVLAVDLAKELEATHLVRGLRNVTDVEYEAGLEYFNQRLAPQLETVYFLARRDLQAISSSRVKELIHFQAPIAGLVPKAVQLEVEKRNDFYKTL